MKEKRIVGIRVDLDLVEKIAKLLNLPDNIPANYAVDISLRNLLGLLEQEKAGVTK